MSERNKAMLLIALVALLFLGGSLLIMFEPSAVDRMTAIAHDAKVTHVCVLEGDDGDKQYTPTFTFEDSDHRTFEAVSAVRYTQEIGVGARYDVRYDPHKPEAGCLIVGHEHRLRGQEASVYMLPFIVIAVLGWLAWKQVGGSSTPGSADKASG